MSKKDYELIAKALKDSKPVDNGKGSKWAEVSAWKNVVEIMTFDLANTNPRFNRAKFLQACGYND